ncbi:cyclase family protein [Nisaea acidiphila]|uniref:Cyclase family protein n=1 Tax=Nisaea acidiphila TaxID=1862145 RepID=A0A9J7AU89_9PROT|nr:cyclase family protein [Nisaea acidiphila]UUX50049.1 cyclase family protein [Nisaea acidiphila]
MTTPRWKNRPEGSNWGDFGPDDQIGRLNFLTPEKVLQGIAEVKHGKSFCLSMPLDYPGGTVLSARRRPPQVMAGMRNGRPYYNYAMQDENPDLTDVITDDAVLIYTQYSTQWDALAHVGSHFDADGDGVDEMVYYNGFRAGTDVIGPEEPHFDEGTGCTHSGVEARKLGIESMAATGVQGRGCLIDLAHHFGMERKLIGYEEVMRACEADGVEVEKGDLVCLHTGFAKVILDMNKNPDPKVVASSCVELDGRDEKLLKWIDESGLAALIADNFSVEAFPGTKTEGRHATLPLHELCLFKLGIHLGELWYLSDLANWLRENGRSRFLLTAPPLRLPGAVGSPVTPIATV